MTGETVEYSAEVGYTGEGVILFSNSFLQHLNRQHLNRLTVFDESYYILYKDSDIPFVSNVKYFVFPSHYSKLIPICSNVKRGIPIILKNMNAIKKYFGPSVFISIVGSGFFTQISNDK